MIRHTVLLIFSAISIAVGQCLKCLQFVAEIAYNSLQKNKQFFIQISFSCFSGIAHCSTTLLYDSITESGIYYIILFLDTNMNFGQGLMTCAIFGFESKHVFLPLQKWFKKVHKLYKRSRNRSMQGEERMPHASWSLTVLEKIFWNLPRCESTNI